MFVNSQKFNLQHISIMKNRESGFIEHLIALLMFGIMSSLLYACMFHMYGTPIRMLYCFYSSSQLFIYVHT